MDKIKIINQVMDCGVVAVIRADGEEQALKISEQCAKAGILALEITFTVPGASEVIRALTRMNQKLLIGAGTVLDPETARAAILAGAQFVVSPCLNRETAALCNRYQIPYFAGAMTIKEIVECLECGVDIVKLFPGDLFGPAFIKAVKGPLPNVKIMPTGGVNPDNIQSWIRAGAVAVGIGGNLTKGAKTGDYDSVYQVGKIYVDAVKAARTE